MSVRRKVRVVINICEFGTNTSKVRGKLGLDAKVAIKIMLFGSDHLVNRFVTQFVPNHLVLLLS